MKKDPVELAKTVGQVYDKKAIIYKNANENLKEIFTKYNIKNKDVLTVLASSDQALSFYYAKAKTIDTFDRNYLTLYYYYLRKWLILYKNQLYPSHKFINFTGNGDIELYHLVCSIIPQSDKEKEAQIFWKKFMEYNEYKSNFLFEDRYCLEDKPFDNEIEKIKNFFDNEVTFNNIDITEPVYLNKQYDIVYLSNMLEYEEVEDKRNIVKNNLENLLKSNGIVICTYKIRNKKDDWHKAEVNDLTTGYLKLDNEYSYYEPLIGGKKDLAYSYKKRSK